jgi:hypothetical protein
MILVESIISRTGVKINIPSPEAKTETIIITGERDVVDVAAKEIRSLYEAKV